MGRSPARVPAWIALFLLVFGVAAWSDAQTRLPRPLPNRIRQRPDDQDLHVLAGNRSVLARPDFDRGRLDPRRSLERLALVFKPSAGQAAELEALLAAQQDPSSAQYHQWLTPDEFAARFGMSDADLANVTGWLSAHGFRVHGASRSRQELYFSGSVAQVEDAFHTEIHEYLVDGELHRANAVDPSIPAAYAGVVLAVRNLSDFRPRPRVHRPLAASRFTSSISGGHFMAPDDFATIYGLKSLYAAGFDGTGQKIAVVGQSALAVHNATSDIDAFRAASGLPPTHLQQVLVPNTGSAKVCDGDVTEADLDVEWSGAVAPAATVVYVYTGVTSGQTCTTTPFGVWDALQYAVDHDVAPVISTSYGACEALNGSNFALMVRGWAQQANSQGQSITAATGDTGAADCDDPNSPVATQGLAVDVPASIPEVTGAGGTEFEADTGSPATYWSSTNDASNGSALQYIPETGWNDTETEGSLSSGGGGASTIFSKPPWQTGTGVPNDGHRDVPDVSLDSSFSHDGYLICSQGLCVNGYRAQDQTLDVVGGTSIAAPSLAGILALINGGTGSSGLGSPNPTLYALAASAPSAFHDVTSGGNAVPCQPGSSNCPASAPFQVGFTATPGYDRATGLGSVNAGTLATHWAANVATTTSLAVSSASSPVGTAETFTATVTPASAGFGSPAGGQVQFSIDGVDAGTPVPVTKSGSSYKASYMTGSLTGGGHAIGAAYGGNLVYLASSAAPSAVTVTDFSIVATPGGTIAAGASAMSTLTVTAQSGFTGTVSLTCAGDKTDQVGCQVQPSSLVLGSGSTTQMATLTVSTKAPPAKAMAGLVSVIALLGLATRRRRAAVLGLALFLFASTSCGGGGGGGGGSGGANVAHRATPAGTYMIGVTASSGPASHSVSVPVTVQ
ncbi:MAG TPA: protease pro-enzyme activation domain-containing protein [Myxococcota bacterium]|nr:protease pro-enzyme activation domain-containing protein [Myxococcota bacterium]